jgi:hypothetical protein
MSYRNINFVTNGFAASNYTPASPIGNQFITPYGDPYRVEAVGGVWDVVGSIFSGIGKITTSLLPIATPLAGAAVSSLLTKAPKPQAQATQQNRFDTAAEQTVAVQASAAAEKSNQTVYLVAGGVTLLALFYFMSKRK